MPTDRDELSALWEDWDDSSERESSTRPNAPRDVVHRQRLGSLQRQSSASPRRSTTTRKALPSTTPTGRQGRWDTAVEAIRQADGEARARRPGVEPGLCDGAFATIFLSRVDDRLHQGPGRRAPVPANGTSPASGRRRQLGRSYLAIPAATEHHEEAYALIEWLTAPSKQIRCGRTRSLPVQLDRRGGRRRGGCVRRVLSNAPIGAIFKELRRPSDRAARPQGRRDQGHDRSGLNRVDQRARIPRTWQQTLDEIASAIG